MIDAFGAADAGVVAAAGAVIVFAIIFALARGQRGEPLELLADWARTRGLEYVAPQSDEDLAAFVGKLDGFRVRVAVTRVAVGFGDDVPTRLTTVTVGDASGATVCVLQPVEWVMDRHGREAGKRLPTGDPAFDARWAVRGVCGDGDGVDEVGRVLSSGMRSRLLEADAGGLIVEVALRAVSVVMPGICADARELDRRVAVASTLALALEWRSHGGGSGAPDGR